MYLAYERKQVSEMTKYEWLNNLRESLMVELPLNEIDQNMQYYRNYIETESRTRSEEEVLQSLGEPRLIAKTIIDTYQMQRGASGYNAYDQEAGYDYTDAFERFKTSDYNTQAYQERENSNGTFYYHVEGLRWYHKALLYVLLALVLVIVVFIGGIILKLFFSIGIPVLCILFIYRLIKQR